MVLGTGFIFTESDAGTKRKTMTALQRTAIKLDAEFIKAAKDYWYYVWQTARRLCFQMGAWDTGTLYNSIRLLWVTEPYGGLYEVSVSARGADITAMIKVGGMEFINPKTGRYCDYAQAVHDGTRYMAGRPFLTMAVDLAEPYLQQLLSLHVDKALQEFTRDC